MSVEDDVIGNQNTTKSAEHTPVLEKRPPAVVFYQGLDCQPTPKGHRKLARSTVMDTLDVPSSNENLAADNEVITSDGDGVEGVMPSDERRRGLASRSFRANWQIMSASFNSDVPERYTGIIGSLAIIRLVI